MSVLPCPLLLPVLTSLFFFNDPPTTQIYTLSLHDALPISVRPAARVAAGGGGRWHARAAVQRRGGGVRLPQQLRRGRPAAPDRKSTRLNSSHLGISYAVFCLKKKNTK